MPDVELPDQPGAAVVEGVEEWTFAELSGEQHTFGSLKGKPVFLHYWRPSDAGVVDVLASIQRLRKSVDDVYYVLVGDADQAAIRAFVSDKAPRLPYVVSSSQLPLALAVYRSESMATTWLIDAQGRLATVHAGPARWDTDRVRRFLDALR